MDFVRVVLLALCVAAVCILEVQGSQVGVCQYGAANYYLKDSADRRKFFQCTNRGAVQMCCAPGTCCQSTFPDAGSTANPCEAKSCIGLPTTPCVIGTTSAPTTTLAPGATVLTPTSATINVDSTTCSVCNFDPEKCNFYDDQTDQFDWTMKTGSTPTANTGPTTDQNVGTTTGNYYYMESSTPRSVAEKARLLSPTLTGSSTRCLKFYYHMYGANIGTFNVYMYLAGVLNKVFTQTGNKANSWLFAQVPLPAGSYQVVFEGIVGGEAGDLAVDNIQICKGDCTLTCPTPPPVTTTTAAPSNTHNLLTSNFTCDFGSTTASTCSFTTDPNCQKPWTTLKGSTPTATTGPTADKSSSGYYYYTEVTGANTGDKFCFVTQPFKGDKGKCLKFWYHMEGANIGTLNVYTRAYGGGDHKLWTKTGAQGSAWVEATVNLPAGEIQLRFEGVKTGGTADDKGDIAVDDIQVLNGGCPPTPDYCTFNPCQNGGTCVSSPTGFTCTCPTGKLGPLCSLFDYCNPNPCQNGGTCKSGMTGYSCSCTCGYGGATCTDCGCASGCWVVIQKRTDGTLDFDKNYSDYEDGFGAEATNYWMGLTQLNTMTTRCKWKLEVQLTKWDGTVLTVTYDTFSVDTKANKYKLSIGGFSAGTSGLGDALGVNNGASFSAKDKDQDGNTSESCAQKYGGGWWYTACHAANLNGPYPTSATCQLGGGQPLYCIPWALPPLTYLNYAFKGTQMRITPQ